MVGCVCISFNLGPGFYFEFFGFSFFSAAESTGETSPLRDEFVCSLSVMRCSQNVTRCSHNVPHCYFSVSL